MVMQLTRRIHDWIVIYFFDPAALKPHVSTRIAIMTSGKKIFDMMLIPIAGTSVCLWCARDWAKDSFLLIFRF
jgi:hypothetical protein